MKSTLYRAVPTSTFDPEREYYEHKTARAPTNVPYIVDNLLEYLRPNDMPSRRFSAYASSKPELALANASSASHSPADYVVCEVVITGTYRLAQINVTDARYHTDVRILQRLAMGSLGERFENHPLAERLHLAAMFTPLLGKSDFERIAADVPHVRGLLDSAAEVSTFWKSASLFPQPKGDGELFFDLVDGAKYTLRPLA